MTVNDGTYTATVDRIVDGVAVVLIEEDGAVIDELHPEESELPAGSSEGSVVNVTVLNGEVSEIEERTDETTSRRERLREKFDRLSERPPDGDDE